MKQKTLEIYPEQWLSNLVDAAEDYRWEIHFREGGGGGGDGCHNSAAGEVHDGSMQEDCSNSQRGKDNHQP